MKFNIRTPNNSLSTNANSNIKRSRGCTFCTKKASSKMPTCHNPHTNNKKINLISLKKNTINSLNEVEHFLCNFQNICKYLKLYKLLH